MDLKENELVGFIGKTRLSLACRNTSGFYPIYEKSTQNAKGEITRNYWRIANFVDANQNFIATTKEYSMGIEKEQVASNFPLGCI